MAAKHDIVIVGAGPGGSACAIALAHAGFSPLVIEKTSFPRYHIGESLTGEAAQLLRKLGLQERMDGQKFPIKRGVKVYGRGGQNEFWIPTQWRDADGKLNDGTTWQVRREDFDFQLMEHAKSLGVQYVQGEALIPLVLGDTVTGVRVKWGNGMIEDVTAKCVVDASGSAQFMARKSNLTSPIIRGQYDRQVAVFTQVNGARRDPGDAKDNTLIFYKKKNHWAWFIPLSDELVSVGVVTPGSFLKENKDSLETYLELQFQTLNPELAARVGEAEIVMPARTISNYSYHVENFVGKGFLCVGDSHRFIDPIFSFGVHFGIYEGVFAAEAILKSLDAGAETMLAEFRHYQEKAERGQDIIQDMLDYFWEQPLGFLLFVHLKYREEFIDLFAGRIYSEEALTKPGLLAMRRHLEKTRLANRVARP